MKCLTTAAHRPIGVLSDMDRVFNRFFETGNLPVHQGFAVDIAECEDGYRVIADLPGFTSEEVDVRVEDNCLVIEAKTERAQEEEKEGTQYNWRVRERFAGNFKRSFVLPDEVDRASIEAEMKNGCLSVDLKRRPETKPFSIKVKS
ncbi:MAG: hypothetical protein B0D92_08100 [Spirochaeta sp. LUC14_002_19_P3]|nr:MAG: hypothetical protein B0D92_08100 [Spirochaeta sp. LUC14_002_19_P3]